MGEFDLMLAGKTRSKSKVPLGTPPKVNSCIFSAAPLSEKSPKRHRAYSRTKTLSILDMRSSPPKPDSPSSGGNASPLPIATRSRGGSTNSQKYVPPRLRQGSQASSVVPSMTSDNPRDSDQARIKQGLSWDSDELSKRQRALIGKTVVGKLSPKRGNRYFVKWNINANDTIVISSDKVEEILGDTPPAGMWVSCTIVGLGPGHVQWNKQHPYAMTLESRETRASHQPGKGKLPANSPYWKKNQKAGLVRQVTNEVNRQTMPAEIDIARAPVSQAPVYIPPAALSRGSSIGSRVNGSRPPIAPSTATSTLTSSTETTGSQRVIPMPPPNLLPKGVILPQTVEQPTEAPVSLAKRTNGANINLVTGEVKSRGRSDTVCSWRRGSRDRGFTV